MTYPYGRWLLWSFFACATALSQGVAQAPTSPWQLSFGSPKELLRDMELNLLGDLVVSRDGVAYLLDVTNYQVVAIDSLGNPLWRSGRQGSGPGEFRVPYRLAARPEGGVAVLDWGAGRVSLISKTGKSEGTLQLPFPFTQIDGMAILPDGRYVIAAMTSWGGPRASDRSVHVFTDSMSYRTSFGALATALDTAAVRYVGSGGFTLDRRGRILLTPKRPYEIRRYSDQGELIERIAVGADLKYDLGDFISIQRNGGQTFKSTTTKTRFVEVPVPVQELPSGGYIGGRGTFESTTVDLISSTGALEASVRNPAGCVQVLGIDTDRNQLYCKALHNDVPVLLRVPFMISRGGMP